MCYVTAVCGPIGWSFVSAFTLLALSIACPARMRFTFFRERKIVLFKPDVPQETQIELVRSSGGRIVKMLPFINAAVAEFSRMDPQVEKLAAMPELEAIEDDGYAKLLLCWSSPLRPYPRGQVVPWGVIRVKAREAWERSRGAGVKVAVLDTGVDVRHPDLRESLKGWTTAIPGTWAGTDPNGHGTHVAGIIAARDNEFGVVGVAPEAEIYSVKVFDKWGRGRISNIVEGLAWCVENDMNVVNMSFGTSQDSQAMKIAIGKSLATGAILVAAAGNEGNPNSVLYPARYEGVLAVSATDERDGLAPFSSYGPEVKLAAPGVEIYSTYKNRTYKKLSGTSMAAPHVSGTAALVLGLNPKQTAEDVRRLLLASAERLKGLTPDQQGAGLVNAGGAVKSPPLRPPGRVKQEDVGPTV